MINIADGFQYLGNKPLDSRLKYTSVADMKAVPDADLYDGCLAYVTANQTYYSYDSSNTVDTTTGKWRELETGGGGATDFIPIVTTLPTPSAEYMGKFVFYTGSDTTTSSGLVLRYGTVYKCTNDPDNNIVWMANGNCVEGYVKSDDAIELTTSVPALEAGDMRARLNLRRSTTPTSGSALPITSGAVYSALANKQDKIEYSTSEKAIGTWINGRTLYEKVIDCGTMPNSSTKSVAHGISGLSKVIACEGCYNANSGISAGSINYSDTGQLSYNTAVTVDATYVKVKTAYNYTSYNCFVILRYTK